MRNTVIISSESIENEEEYNGMASGSAACLEQNETKRNDERIDLSVVKEMTYSVDEHS
jgi:hypothetical protein